MMAAGADIRGRHHFQHRGTSKPAYELKLVGTMNTLRVAKALWILICAGTLGGCERVRVGPWALARMAHSILMEPRASPDIQDKDTAARAGPEIVTARVGPAPNFLPLTISLHDEVVSEGSSRLLRPTIVGSSRAGTIPIAICCWLRQQGLYGRSRYV